MLKRFWNLLFSVSVVFAGIGFFVAPQKASALGSLDRLSGANRIETAIAISKRLFPTTNSAKAVILARHDNFADALAANSLAGLADAPILLNPGGKALDSKVKTEIDRLLKSGKTIYIAGGTAAIPTSVDNALKGSYKIKRIAGSDRYDTAKKIKLEGDALRGSAATEAIITRGDNFPDALSASSYSAFSGAPIILVKQDKVPAASSSILTPTIKSTYIIGGTAAITNSVKTTIESLTKNLATRISGANRYATSAAVANFFFATPLAISVATGTDYPDALAGGALAGKSGLTPFGLPVLLTKPTSTPAELEAYLKSHASTIDNTLSGYLFGGFAAVDLETELRIELLI